MKTPAAGATSDQPLGRILVVDPDPAGLARLSSVLHNAGYEVHTAADGAAALEQFAVTQMDCIVSEVNLPNLSGFELCAMVRVLPGGERAQVLFRIDADDYDSIQRAYESGGNDFTLQHINPIWLLERVRFLFRAQGLQDRLRLSEQRLAYAQRLAVLGHWERTLNGATLAASSVVCQLLGVDEPHKLSWRMLCAQVPADDLAVMEMTMQRAIAQRSAFRLEHRLLSKQRHTLVLRHQGEVVQVNEQWIIRSTVQDVTESRAQEDRIRFLAFHDPLTALPNRDSATRSLKQILQSAATQQNHVAVFALGLDDFHRITSSLGQNISDTVLRIVGDRLRSQVRNSDMLLPNAEPGAESTSVVARTEGDKFLCVVSHLHLTEATIGIAKRLQAAVASHISLGDTELQLSASVGISIYPEDGRHAEELIDNAFAALLHANDQKGSCQFFATEISDRARQRLTLESELRQAIDSRQFELHYQPRMTLLDNVVRGAEALVRWRHPSRGLVMPGDFIPVLEEAGLIVPLGNLVIEMAARQAVLWRRLYGAQFRVSFNISALQFAVPGLLEAIDQATQQAGASYQNLEVEITESAFMSRPEEVIHTLHAFRERGLRVALDDFGTGFSSLSYLRTLPLDTLKIDRSFVADIGVGQHGSSLVNAIMHMANALGLNCVAEGVELDSQLHFLATSHCQEVQGYLLSRPLPATDFERWMRNWQSVQQDKLA